MIIHVLPWPLTEADIDRHVGDRHRVDSLYVETMWLPILGPTATWALRSLARSLDHWPEGSLCDLAKLSWTLGLPERALHNDQLPRALRRLQKFNLVKAGRALLPRPSAGVTEITLHVRQYVPPLTAAQLAHRPEWTLYGGPFTP